MPYSRIVFVELVWHTPVFSPLPRILPMECNGSGDLLFTSWFTSLDSGCDRTPTDKSTNGIY